MSGRDFGPLRDDAEAAAVASMISVSFGHELERARGVVNAFRPHVRALRRDGEVVGGMVLVPMGQYFGGKSVSSTGVTSVSVPPELRGKGVATDMMRATIRELARNGTALSVLYPVTHPLYRRVGYELAGGHYKLQVPPTLLDARDRKLPVRPLEPTDARLVERLYRSHARQRAGWLDRGPYIWSRVRDSQGHDVRGYIIEGPDGPEGYLTYHTRGQLEGPRRFIDVRDIVTVSARAAHRALALLADHGSLNAGLQWHGGPDDPHVYLLSETGARASLVEPWMLRIVDVAAALGQRGYSRAVTGRLELRVTDGLVSRNRGRFVLDVASGVPTVRRGGRGSLELSERGLASLYSGHMSAHQLAATGMLAGSARVLDVASALFAGPAPSLADFF